MTNPLKWLLNTARGILLNSTLRILLVLLLLVSSLTIVAMLILTSHPLGFVIPVVVLDVTTALHHWFVMIKRGVLKEKPRFGSLLDLILTTAECTLFIYLLKPWEPIGPYLRYQTTAYITLISGCYVQVVCVCLLWAIRFVVIVIQAVDEPSGVVTKPFDFYALATNTKPAIYTLISGASIRIYRLRSHCDRHWFVFSLRRFFTIVIALALLVFSYTNLVLEPVQEIGATPKKLYTAPASSDRIDSGNWSIVAFARNYAFGDALILQDAVHVNAFGGTENATVDSFCPIRNSELPDALADLALIHMNNFYVKMVVFECPFADLWPDLLITVNFTTLGINATFPPTRNTVLGTVSIVVGMHLDILDVIHNTRPIPLVPDAHLLGGVIPTIQKQFKKPRLASLGVFGSTKMFLTCVVPFLSPDPSSQIPRDNNTATLRLYLADDYSDTHFSVEYREKSILSGISALGGFWTVLSGLFTMVFGTTLMFVLFGTRPLSMFGLIHKIPKFRPVLDDEPNERYRNLLWEGPSDKGMLDYVRDHFVDLSPFQNNRDFNDKPDPGTIPPDLEGNKINEKMDE